MKTPWYKSNRSLIGAGLIIFGLFGLICENDLLPPKVASVVVTIAGAAVIYLRRFSV